MKRTANTTTKRQIKSPRKTWVGIALVILVVFITALVWLKFHLARKSTDTKAATTSTAPSAQPQYKGGSKTTPTPTQDSNATGTDQSGLVTAQASPSSEWTKSSNGTSIVVYGPSKNSVFASGDSVFGAATSSSVSYRLSDNVSGLLTTGTASVVNGKFSIKLSFSSSASSGNIEVFNQVNPYGPESNNVLVPVRFKE